jgi:hypothetical protein
MKYSGLRKPLPVSCLKDKYMFTLFILHDLHMGASAQQTESVLALGMPCFPPASNKCGFCRKAPRQGGFSTRSLHSPVSSA